MSERLSIAAAALRLGRSYNQVLRMVLVGQLQGAQDERGRWLVERTSVDRLAEVARPNGDSHPTAA